MHVTYSLYLYEEPAPEIESTISDIENYLIQHGIAGILSAPATYQPGNRLMEYINFLGCSPTLSCGENQSFIRLHLFDQLTGLGGLSIESIRYPECRHPVKDAVSLLINYPVLKAWKCPVCGNKGLINEFNWRKTAGISTLFIEISPIFPKEALPNDKLLQLLQNFSDTNWTWFYSQSSHQLTTDL